MYRPPLHLSLSVSFLLSFRYPFEAVPQCERTALEGSCVLRIEHRKQLTANIAEVVKT